MLFAWLVACTPTEEDTGEVDRWSQEESWAECRVDWTVVSPGGSYGYDVFDRRGRLIERDDHTNVYTIHPWAAWTYEEDRLTHHAYTEGGDRPEVNDHFYWYEDGRLVEETWDLYGDGTTDAVLLYEYDAAGYVIREEMVEPSRELYVRTYVRDSEGRILSTELTVSQGVANPESAVWQCEFNPDGSTDIVREIDITLSSGVSVATQFETLDRWGSQTQFTQHYRDKTTEIETEYDASGRWLERNSKVFSEGYSPTLWAETWEWDSADRVVSSYWEMWLDDPDIESRVIREQVNTWTCD